MSCTRSGRVASAFWPNVPHVQRMADDCHSLEDGDGPASFKSATLRIQTEKQQSQQDFTTLTLPVSTHIADDRRAVSSEAWGPRSGSELAEDENTAPPIDPNRDLSKVSPKIELAPLPWTGDDICTFFSSRDGVVEKAASDSIATYVQCDIDGHVLGAWLLTEISIWDAEKERLVLLTTNSLLVVKYDFIALKPLEVRRTLLHQMDTIVMGDLVYPQASLVPRLNSVASGVSTVVKGCLLRWSRPHNPTELYPAALDLSKFESRSRNMKGVRVMWNNGESLAFTKKWNPFNTDVPFLTFTYHPLHWHKAGKKQTDSRQRTVSYDSEQFSQELVSAMEKMNQKTTKCTIQHKNILLSNYVSLGSLIHNRNSLGFFKVRGRFSF